MRNRRLAGWIFLGTAVTSLANVLLPAADRPASQPATKQVSLPPPVPVPQLQIVPLPLGQASFTRDGSEIARYCFSSDLRRPFLFPLVGPAGRSLTRMGHPRDPESHSHHNSVWIAHNDVNGVSFWDDRQKGRIVHQRIDAYDDEGAAGDVGGTFAAIRSTNHWINSDGGAVLMVERRQTRLETLPGHELLVILDLQWEAPPKATEPVTLGKTPFGPIGVRMAKTIGVNDGGGTIRNSEGAAGEKAIFWKPAKWVDYSGPITNTTVEGITLLDHPSNPNHPSGFHVRADGWMGASLTLAEARKIEPGKPLRLRYGLYVHAGQAELSVIERIWDKFAKTTPPDLTPKKR